MDLEERQKAVSVDEAVSQAHDFLAPVLGKGNVAVEDLAESLEMLISLRKSNRSIFDRAACRQRFLFPKCRRER